METHSRHGARQPISKAAFGAGRRAYRKATGKIRGKTAREARILARKAGRKARRLAVLEVGRKAFRAAVRRAGGKVCRKVGLRDYIEIITALPGILNTPRDTDQDRAIKSAILVLTKKKDIDPEINNAAIQIEECMLRLKGVFKIWPNLFDASERADETRQEIRKAIKETEAAQKKSEAAKIAVKNLNSYIDFSSSSIETAISELRGTIASLKALHRECDVRKGPAQIKQCLCLFLALQYGQLTGLKPTGRDRKKVSGLGFEKYAEKILTALRLGTARAAIDEAQRLYNNGEIPDWMREIISVQL